MCKVFLFSKVIAHQLSAFPHHQSGEPNKQPHLGVAAMEVEQCISQLQHNLIYRNHSFLCRMIFLIAKTAAFSKQTSLQMRLSPSHFTAAELTLSAKHEPCFTEDVISESCCIAEVAHAQGRSRTNSISKSVRLTEAEEKCSNTSSFGLKRS